MVKLYAGDKIIYNGRNGTVISRNTGLTAYGGLMYEILFENGTIKLIGENDPLLSRDGPAGAVDGVVEAVNEAVNEAEAVEAVGQAAAFALTFSKCNRMKRSELNKLALLQGIDPRQFKNKDLLCRVLATSATLPLRASIINGILPPVSRPTIPAGLGSAGLGSADLGYNNCMKLKRFDEINPLLIASGYNPRDYRTKDDACRKLTNMTEMPIDEVRTDCSIPYNRCMRMTRSNLNSMSGRCGIDASLHRNKASLCGAFSNAAPTIGAGATIPEIISEYIAGSSNVHLPYRDCMKLRRKDEINPLLIQAGELPQLYRTKKDACTRLSAQQIRQIVEEQAFSPLPPVSPLSPEEIEAVIEEAEDEAVIEAVIEAKAQAEAVKAVKAVIEAEAKAESLPAVSPSSSEFVPSSGSSVSSISYPSSTGSSGASTPRHKLSYSSINHSVRSEELAKLLREESVNETINNLEAIELNDIAKVLNEIRETNYTELGNIKRSELQIIKCLGLAY